MAAVYLSAGLTSLFVCEFAGVSCRSSCRRLLVRVKMRHCDVGVGTGVERFACADDGVVVCVRATSSGIQELGKPSRSMVCGVARCEKYLYKAYDKVS